MIGTTFVELVDGQRTSTGESMVEFRLKNTVRKLVVVSADEAKQSTTGVQR